MGKRKRSSKGKGNSIKIHDSVLGSDDDDFEQPDENKPDYYYDEIDEFHQEREKLLLKEEECPPPESFENQEEVFGLHDDDDSDSEDKDSEADLPDVKAWGKKKSKYYNTDYVDNDYLGYKEEEAEAAQAEEKEVLALQKRLDDEIDENDFGIEWFEKKDQKETHEISEKVGIDLQALSKQEKLEFLQKNSPELFIFVDDFKSRMAELSEKLQPAWTLIEEHKLPEGCWTEYIIAKYQTILQYCTNISFYMMIKTKGECVIDHPVMLRLQTFKTLLQKLDAVEEYYMPIIEQLVKGVDIDSIIEKEEELSNKEEEMEMETTKEFYEEMQNDDVDDNSVIKSSESDEETNDPNSLFLSNDQEEKRGITYQIAKNKGLTPHRKKEVRNPRVRHRKKYEKAKVKRKGQFREPIRELQRYGGEISGIRAAISKSIKLK